MDIDKILQENLFIGIEAMFEADSFDKATQMAFDDAIEKS